MVNFTAKKKIPAKKSSTPILYIYPPERNGRLNLIEHRGYISRVYGVISRSGNWTNYINLIRDSDNNSYVFQFVGVDIEGEIPNDINCNFEGQIIMVVSDHKKDNKAQIWFIDYDDLYKRADDLIRKSGREAYSYSDILNMVCKMRYYRDEFNRLIKEGKIKVSQVATDFNEITKIEQ